MMTTQTSTSIWKRILDSDAFPYILASLLIIAAAAFIVSVLASKNATEYQQQIDLCVRAFDYTRDQ
jgi:hypothetical protein